MTSVSEELELIRSRNSGVIYPADVVQFARDESTALHSKFEWNDGDAAEKYRLWQAREIIRASVTILPRNNQPIQTYVSLKHDRYTTTGGSAVAGGYRNLIEVLSVPSLRKTLLEEAIEEHDRWEKKYQTIKELADIFAAAKTVRQKQALIGASA